MKACRCGGLCSCHAMGPSFGFPCPVECPNHGNHFDGCHQCDSHCAPVEDMSYGFATRPDEPKHVYWIENETCRIVGRILRRELERLIYPSWVDRTFRRRA